MTYKSLKVYNWSNSHRFNQLLLLRHRPHQVIQIQHRWTICISSLALKSPIQTTHRCFFSMMSHHGPIMAWPSLLQRRPIKRPRRTTSPLWVIRLEKRQRSSSKARYCTLIALISEELQVLLRVSSYQVMVEVITIMCKLCCNLESIKTLVEAWWRHMDLRRLSNRGKE